MNTKTQRDVDRAAAICAMTYSTLFGGISSHMMARIQSDYVQVKVEESSQIAAVGMTQTYAL